MSAALAAFEEVRLLHDVDEEHAYERAEYHNAFEREVDDAAALGEDARERDYHQRDGVDEGLLDEERHFASPPFSAFASSGGASAFTSAAGAALAFLRFLPPEMSIFMTSEKALR